MLLAFLASVNGRAWLTTVGGAVAYLGFCGVVGKLRLLPTVLARKLMHIGTGPIYMLCWPLYTAAPASRWLAASVVVAAGLKFALVGSGVVRSEALVAGVSRTGRREELLRGPLFYAIAHVAVTLAYWRGSPAGVMALAVLCGGDGLAEVVGRSAGSTTRRLPHNPAKTWAGSLACWAGGAAAALPLLLRFRNLGMFDAAAAAGGPAAAAALSGWRLAAGVALCSGVGAAMESLPLGDADNFAVPVASTLAARLYFGC